MIAPVPTKPAAPGSIIDTHAHYDDRRFEGFRDELFARFAELGVQAVITCGCDIESSERCISFARKYDCCFAAAGYHPENLPDGKLDMRRLEALLKADKVVAVGEIGLDYYWDAQHKQRQKDAFIAQIGLAGRLGLPVIVHDREAHADTLDILQATRPKGVVHCFSGSAETAREIVKLGMYIGVGGVVTFKNAKRLCEVVKEVPLERILLETDAPYLTPEPFRGQTNNSSLICYVAEKIAQLKGVSAAEVYAVTSKNAKTVFAV